MADPGELLDVSDEWGAHLGVERRDVVHRDGLWHHAFHLWVVSGDEVLLQRRSMAKQTHPGLLDATAAGHIGAGETVLAGGMREVREELGVAYPAEALVPLGVRALSDRVGPGERLVNREFQHVYVVADPRPLEDWTALDPEEVDGLVALRLADFTALTHALAPGPWAARAWDGRRAATTEVVTSEVIAPGELRPLAIMLERFARGERPLAI